MWRAQANPALMAGRWRLVRGRKMGSEWLTAALMSASAPQMGGKEMETIIQIYGGGIYHSHDRAISTNLTEIVIILSIAKTLKFLSIS
jgi:hypothetical protein